MTSRTLTALALVIASLGVQVAASGATCADDSQTQTVVVTVNAPVGWTAAQWNHFIDIYAGPITPAVVAAGPDQVVYQPTNC